MHPVLFEIAGFELRSYGMFLALGLLAGIYITEKEIKRNNLPPGLMVQMAPWAVLAGIFFARLFFVATHPGFFSGAPLQALNLRAGGLNFYGGLSGGTATGAVFLKIKKVSFTRLASCAAPGIAAGLFFGRLGCFLNGCCYGEPSSLPWAVIYRSPRAAAPLNIPLQPSQLYEAAGNLAIFCFLWGSRNKKFLAGNAFFYFLAVYSGFRIFLERFRADTLGYIVPGFAWTDVFFAVIIITSVILIRLRPGKNTGKETGRK